VTLGATASAKACNRALATSVSPASRAAIAASMRSSSAAGVVPLATLLHASSLPGGTEPSIHELLQREERACFERVRGTLGVQRADPTVEGLVPALTAAFQR